jgi:uncharacterized protein
VRRPLRRFQEGRLDRAQMPLPLRRIAPTEALDRLESVDLAELRATGKSLVMLDVDNTLIPWRSHTVPPETHQWLARARALGFRLCLISNTRNPERLKALSEAMGVPFVRAKFKPSREMYEAALAQFDARPEEAVMVGDQLFTDILGANRAGIDAIWVRPMAKREFIGTKLVSRTFERLLALLLYRYFQDDEDDVVQPVERGLYSRNTVRQFAKFVIVGVSSSAIDVGLLFLLMFWVPWDGRPLGTVLGEWAIASYPSAFGFASQRVSDAAVPILKVPVTVVAILNGFYWNRKWTFKVSDRAAYARQLRRYFVVALAAMLVNLGVTTVFNNIIPGHAKLSLAAASAIAIVAAGVFNFLLQRHWTFGKSEP